jgi:acyl dehydratase
MTTETTPSFKADAIGTRGDPVEFEVSAERVAAYAAATNDAIAPHAAGEIAPPVFAIVPAFQAAGIASMQVIPGELLGAILHGEQDFHFHRPIAPGMTLSTTATPIGMRQRSSGVTVVTRAETTGADGEPVVDQYMTTFVRGAEGAEDVGEEAPGHGFDPSLRERDPDAEVSQTFDADQTFRYAEASGDPMQIHLDEQFAKAVGLPGIIIHGLCTMAFTSVAALESFAPDDPTRLKRLAVRFANITLPGQTITTRLWNAGARDGRSGYAYETASDAGAGVIKDGRAEIA